MSEPRIPKPGEVWRNTFGGVRHVRSVDDDGYSVTYSRPKPAHPDWVSVLMPTWLLWVETTGATCRLKEKEAVSKDWGYIA